MGYVESLLGQNEEIIFSTRQHWLVLAAQTAGNLVLCGILEIGGLAVIGLSAIGVPVSTVVGLAMLVVAVIPIIKLILNFLAGDPWGTFLKKSLADILILAFLLIVGVLLLLPFPPLGFVLGILLMLVGLYPGFWLFWGFLVWNNRRYLVTTHRVIHVEGIFNKNVLDSSLEKVNDISMTQSVMGRLLGYGDLVILTASEIGKNPLRRLSRPVVFKTTILDQKEKLGELDRFERRAARALPPEEPAGPAAAVPPSPPEQPSVPDLIAELAELRDKGIITPEEFEAKKAELLARL